MPFARISLLAGKSPAYLTAISESLHAAMVECFEVPAKDRFHVIHQHQPGELVFDRDYLGGPRSDDFILFAISAGRPRTEAMRRGFFKRLVALLSEQPGIRPEDVMIIITTSGGDEWSLSHGAASMLDGAPAKATSGASA